MKRKLNLLSLIIFSIVVTFFAPPFINIFPVSQDVTVQPLPTVEETIPEKDVDPEMENLFGEEEEEEAFFEEEEEEELDDEEEELDEEDIPSTITIPFIGEINIDLSGAIRKASGATSSLMQTAIGKSNEFVEKKIISLGPLLIDNIVAWKSEAGKLNFEAAAKFLGKTASIVLDSAEEGAFVFSLKLQEAANLALSPWKSVLLKTFKLNLSEEIRQLTTSTILDELNPKSIANFIFNLDPENLFAEFSVEQFNPADIFGIAKDSPIAQAIMNKAKIVIKNPFTAPDLKFDGLLDLSKVDIGLKIEQMLKTSGFFNKEKGLDLSSEINNLELPFGIGKIKSAKFILKKEPQILGATMQQPGVTPIQPLDAMQQPGMLPGQQIATPLQKQKPKGLQVLLEGSSSINIPFGLGSVDTTTRATLAKNLAGRYVLKFESTLDKEIKLHTLKITNNKIAFATDGTFEFSGKSSLAGSEIITKFTNKKVTSGKKKGKFVTEFSGSLAENKPLKPFADIPGLNEIKEIKDISLENVKIGLRSDKTFYFSGLAAILGLKAETVLNKVKGGISLNAVPPKDWKITDMIAEAKGTILEKLDLSSVKILASSTTYLDKELGVMISKGFSLFAKIPLDNLGEIKEFLKDAPKELTIAGTIGTSLKSCALTIEVPISIKIGDSVEIKKFSARIGGLPPQLSFISTVEFTPPKAAEDEKLIFSSKIFMDPITATLGIAGSMEGKWENPFGIKGLTVGDLALEAGINIATLIPSRIGFAGKTYVGEKTLEIATKITWPRVAELALVARMTGEDRTLSLKDLATIPAKAGVKLPIDKLPDISIYDLNIYIVPIPLKIGEILYDQGITVSGKLQVYDKAAEVFATIKPEGIIIFGYMPKVKLGNILELSGVGKDRELGTPDDGPIIDIKITPEEQYLFMDGQTTLLQGALSSYVHAEITKDGMHFITDTKLFDQIQVYIEGKTVEKNGIIEDFTIDGLFRSDLTETIKNEIIKAANKMNEMISGGIDKAQHEVDKIQGEINRLNKLIKGKKDYIHGLRKKIKKEKKKKWYNENKFKLGQWHLQIAGLEVDSTALKGAKEAAKALLDVASDILDEMEKSSDYANREYKKLISSVLGLFVVRKVTMHFSLKALTEKGKMPKVSFYLTVAGKNLEFKDLQFDWKTPAKSAETVANKIFAHLKKEIKKLG